MNTKERISALESRQLELRDTMAKSDAHAAKCVKTGRSFQEEYPSEYSDYLAANEEFNANETILQTLREEVEKEEEI